MDKVIRLGMKAHQQGLKKTDNPYPVGHKHYKSWLHGWMTTNEKKGRELTRPNQ